MATMTDTQKSKCNCISCEFRNVAFTNLSDKDMSRVCEAREERHYARGEIIHHEGDAIHDFKYLKHGLVKLVQDQRRRRRADHHHHPSP